MKIIREEKLKPLIVHTGKFTGRSPKDRYLVRNTENKDVIDWGDRNQSISEEIFNQVYQKIQE